MIVEYKLDINFSGELVTPPWVSDGGYFYNPSDKTYIGWTPDPANRSFKVPDSVTRLTLEELKTRVLGIHSVTPYQKGENARDAEDKTTTEVEDMVTTWYNSF